MDPASAFLPADTILICDVCNFVAKNRTGLGLHRGKGKCLKAQTQKTTPVNRDAAPEEILLDKIQRLRSSTKLLRRIPKSARLSVAEYLTTIFRECVT